MLRSTFWRQLRVALMAGLVAGGLGALTAYRRMAEPAEFFAFDQLRHLAQRFTTSTGPEPVAMVAIDEGSIRDVRSQLEYEWPWPRSLLGIGVEELRALGAKVVVLDSFYFDYPVRGADDEVTFVQKLQKAGNVVVAAQSGEDIVANLPHGRWAAKLFTAKTHQEALDRAVPLLAKHLNLYVVPPPPELGTEVWLGGFGNPRAVEDALEGLSSLRDLELDHKPEIRELTVHESDGAIAPEDWVLHRDVLHVKGLDLAALPPEDDWVLPRPEVSAVVARVGFADDLGRSVFGDVPEFESIDNDDRDLPSTDVQRSVRLFVRHGDVVYPTLSLAALLAAEPGLELHVDNGRLHYGKQSVPITRRGYMYVNYPPGPAAFGADLQGSGRKTLIPFSVLLRSARSREKGLTPEPALQAAVKGKIVVVGNLASALQDRKITPIPAFDYGSAVVASALRTLMLGDSISRARRELDARWAMLMGLLGAFYALLTFRYTRSDGFLVFTALGMAASVALYVGYALHVLVDEQTWLAVFAPGASFALAAVSTGWINFGETNADRALVADALGRFTSPAIVESVLRNPLLIAPKRRELTILFSDIAGFTGISESIPAPRLAELLSTYFTEMTAPITSTQGHVDKFIGDAVMAFWNAPLANEKHAILACKAALSMRDKLEKLKPALEKEYGVKVSARIGLNSGEVVVGELGSRGKNQEHKSNYTCVGDAVNLASRLEGVNKQYGTQIVCGPRTVELVGDGFIFRELDRVRVKGKQEPVGIFELVAGKHDKLPIEQRTFLERYAQGLAAYRARDFEKAKAHFEDALKLAPADGPSAIFRDRCAAYLAKPPPPAWDGTHDLHEK